MLKRFLFVALLAVSACASDSRTVSGIDPVMKRFAEEANTLPAIVRRDGPPAALAHLAQVIADEPDLADVCHGLTHVIGEAAYDRYGFQDALAFEHDLCGSGYIHGIVESYMETVDDLPAAMRSICEPDDPKCFHGIGHGLMYRSINDVPGSLALCDTYDERFQKAQCAEGVFMENFDADEQSHDSDYLDPADPFSACRGRDPLYEGVCAFYMVRYYIRLHPRAYVQALDWCETIPAGPRDACVKGVGDTAMKQNIGDPQFAETVCDSAVPERRRYCIEGVSSYFVVHHASTVRGRAMCGTLREENRAACIKIVDQSVSIYPN